MVPAAVYNREKYTCKCDDCGHCPQCGECVSSLREFAAQSMAGHWRECPGRPLIRLGNTLKRWLTQLAN